MLGFLAVLHASLALFAGVAAAPQQARSDFFGIAATTMLAEEEEAAEAELLGVGRVRMNVEWGLASAGGTCEAPGPAEWAHYDEVFRRAAEHGLEVIADLYGNLADCGSANAFPVPGSGNFTAYTLPTGTGAGAGTEGGFVAQVVRRYGTGGTFWAENPTLPADPVTTWEVWNEPNLPHNNAADVIDPQAYAQFLIASSAAIRGVDPTATVVLGGMSFSGAPPTSPKSMNGFLTAILDEPSGYTPAAFEEAFEGVGIHPYAVSGQGSTYRFGGPEVSEVRTTEARELLDSLGAAYAEKSLWVTELGWPAEFAPSPELTPAVQAEYAATTMAWLFDHAEEDDIRYAALFTYRDYHSAEGCSEPECWPQYAGFKRLANLPPKPTPGGSETGEFRLDRPLRCVYKALISGASCFEWQTETIPADAGGPPALASRGLGHLEALTRGPGGVLEDRSWDPADSWSAGAPLPGPAAASGPAAVSWGPERVDVVARLADGTIEHWSGGEGPWSAENIGGASVEAPALASWGPERLDLFVRGTDSSLEHRSWEPASGWSEPERLPGPPIVSAPAAVAPSSGRLEVLAEVVGGAVERWSYAEGAWTTEGLGGVADSAPAVASTTPESLDAFVRGPGGALLHDSFEPASGWSGWRPVPGARIDSAPAAVAQSTNRLDVLAAVEGGVGHWFLEG